MVEKKWRSGREKRSDGPFGLQLEELTQDEPVGTCPVRELIRSLMWLATQKRPNIANALQAVARYCAGLSEIRWKTALVILVFF